MAKTMNDEMADCDLPDYSDYEPNVDDLGLFKRSVERWHADFAFRDRYRADREKALADVGLEEIDPDDLDILVFKKQAREATNGQRPH